MAFAANNTCNTVNDYSVFSYEQEIPSNEKPHRFNSFALDSNVPYGYGSCKSIEALTDKICDMYENMVLPAIPNGLCGCIYTQLSDVEEELNGFYTYDREICKVEKNKIQHIAKKIASAIMF